MPQIDITKLTDSQVCDLINNRWESSSEVWDAVDRVYKQNTRIYANKADWVQLLPYNRKQWAIHANRVFVNMESVINSLIANTPGINVIPSRDGQIAQDFARKLESFFRKKYIDLNVKETFRMGLRNLYFARLIVIKAFWNPTINDFDFRAIDPRKLRVAKYARKEQDSEFAIEEIKDNLCALIDRFPKKKEVLMKQYGITTDADLYIRNPEVIYKEAWIGDWVIFKLQDIILDKIKNPYWDWDGILVTDEEHDQLEGENSLQGNARRAFLQNIKLQQDQRQATVAPVQEGGEAPEGFSQPGHETTEGEVQPTPAQYKPYLFNYFNTPRKPYIIATIFNNKNTPIGRTDMISLSAELQRGIDKRKMDIDENCELVNGVVKVDAAVMGKSDAQRMRFESRGVVWGKGVKDGVTRETGEPLPDMVFKDMLDSRQEIDNIMAASSAFRGEREGQETKAGRLALVQQSYLRLNELVQVVDYVAKEMFDWGMQLAKCRYTEYHYAKWIGKENAREVIELIQDDFETGTEVKILPGKTLPVDDEFKFEQAQNDVKEGYISPVDYLEIAQYDNAKELAKNAVLYRLSPVAAVGMTPEEMQKIPPPKPVTTMREQVSFDDLPAAAKVQVLGRMGIQVTEDQIIQEGNPSPISIDFKDLPPDGKVQAAAKVGIQLDPNIVVAETVAQNKKANDEMQLKRDAQAHGQRMAEKSQALSELQGNNNPNEKA